ncbi:MAG: hypothetical protein DI537_10390 [Stutzerimonas stutzeri]|nr:MAG: hypothetical protein DI537_10390 [Stutzerimonas stutzeri]
MSAVITLGFGKHAGKPLNSVPESYIKWLAAPTYGEGSSFRVPSEVTAAAAILRDAFEAKEHETKELQAQFHGKTGLTKDNCYIVERLGDIDGLSRHVSLNAALEALSVEFPLDDDGFRAVDTEDDRLLIWEVLPTGHKKVVWQFSGDHWRGDVFGLEQGTLPGDDRPLYSMTYID